MDASNSCRLELLARLELGSVTYAVAEEGPEHAKTFTASVIVDGVVEGVGVGRTKKDAEQQAASRAWTALQARLDEGERA